MNIAVTYEDGQIFQHFGHTEKFKFYEIEDGRIVNSQIVDTNGSGHGALAGFLSEYKIDTLICGGIGGGAQAALAEAGIRLFGGCSGDADAAVTVVATNYKQTVKKTKFPEYQLISREFCLLYKVYSAVSGNSDAQCGHFTASICISDLQYGQIFVVGAATGAGFFILLIVLTKRKTIKARMMNCITF